MDALYFKVIADSSQAEAGMKRVGRATDDVGRSAGRANHQMNHLVKSFFGLSTGAESAAGSFRTLSRLGLAGVIGGVTAEGIKKFGEAVKENAKNYYETNKSLADAYESGLNSKTVDQARSALDAVDKRMESIREKQLEFKPINFLLRGAEKLTGMDFGTKDTEKEMKLAEQERQQLEEIVKLRQKETDIAKGTYGGIQAIEQTTKYNKIAIQQQAILNGGRDQASLTAFEELQTASTIVKEYENQLKKLQEINIAVRNEEAYQSAVNDLANARIAKEQAILNLQKAQAQERAKAIKDAQEISGGMLGASKAGRGAESSAERRRIEKNRVEDYRTSQKYYEQERDRQNEERRKQGLPPITVADVQRQEAERNAAGKNPSLAQKIQGTIEGVSPSQIAYEQASGQKAPNMEELLKSVSELLKKLSSAPLVTSGT